MFNHSSVSYVLIKTNQSNKHDHNLKKNDLSWRIMKKSGVEGGGDNNTNDVKNKEPIQNL